MTVEPNPTPHASDDTLLDVKAAAAFTGGSVATVWRGVASGRLPLPVYIAPKAPRWWRSELRAAINATRCTPAEARAARQAQRLAGERAA